MIRKIPITLIIGTLILGLLLPAGTAAGDEWTKATVRDIDVEKGKILLDHETIEKWGMPAMRMVFFADEGVQFDGLEKGDVIEIIPLSKDKKFYVQDYRKPQGGRQGPAATDFTAPSLSGETSISLADFKGRVVILNFWASWCAPCRYEMPHFQALHEAYHDRGLTVLAVNVKDDRQKALAFIEKHNLTFATVFDEGDRIFEAYDLRGPPQTYVIDRAGHLTIFPDPRTGKEIVVTSNPTIWKSEAIIAMIEGLIDQESLTRE